MVSVDGQDYVVEVDEGGEITHYESAAVTSGSPVASAQTTTEAYTINSPLAGNIWKVEVNQGQQVQEGDVLLILEAMKMETQIVAEKSGTVTSISVKPGDTVQVGNPLVTIG